MTGSELGIAHVILNTDCNAWSLSSTPASPGVCRFCYRERNRVATDAQTVTRLLDVIRSESNARRIVFTGGDPLMPYDNHLEVALRHAAELGFEVNIHTNGLLLRERYGQICEWIDLYSLAIDGPDAATADWFRGNGYFETFTDNVALLASDRRPVAFNTFTSAASIGELERTATMILDVASRTAVEYWLISQYRPIGRADARKAALYGFTPQVFRSAVDSIRERMGPIAVFDQPTRAPTDPYPFRVWILADGTVTVDLGSVAAPRNEILGNALADGLAPLVRHALTLRSASFDPGGDPVTLQIAQAAARDGLAIVDIDGTVSDSRPRQVHLDGPEPDWEAFFAGAGSDEPLAEGVTLARELAAAGPILWLTGRPERYRAITEAWLRRQGLPTGPLEMRPDDDMRPAAVFKAERIDQLAADNAIALIVEDEDQVVDTLRSAGWTVHHATWMLA